ncbi:MAG: alpha/beta fold hydrolase, partial [Umezawaea sp.]
IADADRILAYLRDTAAEHSIDREVRLHHKVLGASWSSEHARWTVDVERTDTGQRTTLTCGWLFGGSGYYRYDEGFTPHFDGRERFRGTIVHPQQWPEGLDYAGKRVVVVGSGATAVTIVPAMAGPAAHVTMLQRTPTYILPLPKADAVANLLRKVFGADRGYALTRRKNVAQQRAIWLFCRKYPKAARRLFRWINTKQLPEGYPVDEHFNPPYDPWDQRLCVVPDGDLFRVLRSGDASIVTDRITTFTERGLLLASGRELEADVVVTATGLNVQAFGGIALSVDGADVHLPEKVAYKGMMLSGVPNFAYAVGYTNSSWTLKVGLLCEHFCRLLKHMDTHGYAECRPEVADPAMPTRPFLNFGAGYIARVVDQLPRQGDRMPWLTSMDYQSDVKLLRTGSVTDPELHFSSPDRSTATPDATGDRFADLRDGVRICYRAEGPEDGPPLLLIAGLGLDLTSWPRRMVGAYVDRGFHVIRFDNRDVGRSSRIATPPPSLLRQFLARPRPDAYDLDDMADDVIGLLDHLGVDRAHLVGMSMGGMIAQTVAADHPDRVATLTSIFSTTGHRDVGHLARSTMLRMAKPPARTAEESVQRHLSMLAHIGSTAFPPDPVLEREWATGMWSRGDGVRARAGVPRQISAIQASGDRTARLRRITAPTLVVHGDVDRMVHASGGRATADAIPGARHVEITGMGHHIAPGVVDRLVELTVDLVDSPKTPVGEAR